MQGGLDDLAAQTSGQIDQFSLAASAARTQSVLDIGAAAGTFAATDAGGDFLSGLSSATPDPALNVPDPTGISN